jgi:hypothetical protein
MAKKKKQKTTAVKDTQSKTWRKLTPSRITTVIVLLIIGSLLCFLFSTTATTIMSRM